MKYIRTKDKVLKVRKPFADEYTDNTHIHCYEHPMVHKRDIVKVADTIEELCDELVFEWHRSSISHDNGVWHLYHEISLKEEVENALTDGYREDIENVKNIYGAIWTNKGLIYVAKMNEKGDLELI